MNREEAYTLLEVMAINITGELISSGHLITEQTKLLTKQLEAIDIAIEALTRPKGEWLSVEIIDDDSYNGVNEDAAECSVCGYVSESYYWAKTYYKFCPNCGARMKGGDTE